MCYNFHINFGQGKNVRSGGAATTYGHTIIYKLVRFYCVIKFMITRIGINKGNFIADWKLLGIKL